MAASLRYMSRGTHARPGQAPSEIHISELRATLGYVRGGLA